MSTVIDFVLNVILYILGAYYVIFGIVLVGWMAWEVVKAVHRAIVRWRRPRTPVEELLRHRIHY